MYTTSTDQPGASFWNKRAFQVPARIFLGVEVLLLLAFGVYLLTRAIPYRPVILLGIIQGILLVLVGLLYLRWSQIIWPFIGRWQLTHRAVSKLGACGFICVGFAVSLWFFLRFEGLKPSDFPYGFALGLVILGLLLFSFGVRQGMNSQTGNSQ